MEGVHGGAEQIAVEVALRLDPDRFRSTICVTRLPLPNDIQNQAHHEAERRASAAGMRMMTLRRRSRYQLWAWWPLVVSLFRDRADVIHGHLFGSNMWATVIGRLTRVPHIVVHHHGQADPVRALAERLLTRTVVARCSSIAIAVSHEAAERIIAADGFDRNKVRVVLNGVPRIDEGDGARIRRELEIPPEAPVLISVTRLRRGKAVELVIEAAEVLRASFPELRTLIAGNGAEYDRLEATVRRLGLSAAVFLLGMRLDVQDLLAAATVATLASDYEGTSLAVMEYMEAGLPMVVTRVGGTPELVTDGVEGLLVPPRDPVALAEGIAHLLNDPDWARRLGEAARQRKREEFDIDGLVRRVEHVYDELLVPE